MYTIKDIAEIVEENEHTIRYYAKLGLFPNITRDKYNSRVFNENELADTGMSLDDVRKFMDLSKKGDETARERAMILRDHQNKARANLVKLQKEVQLLEWKTYQLQQKGR